MRHLIVLLALSILAAPAAAQLIPEDASPEKVADGYRFTEGPAAGPDGCIYFTDIPAELILKYDPETGETETVVEESGQANGLMFSGRDLYSCEHGTRSVRWRTVYPEGVTEQLGVIGEAISVARIYETAALNSPNDLAIDQAGHLYFTDPRYGNRDSMEMEIEGVYFLALGDDEIRTDDLDRLRPTRIIDDLTRPNGIVLSPDESILYVADNGTNEIFAYDIEAPGEIENKRLFARLNDGEGGGADGMCVDAQGRLYAAGQGRIWVYNPDGSAAGDFAVGRACTNCTFAADGKTLYITANRGLYRIELNTEEAVAGGELPVIELRLTESGDVWLGQREVASEDIVAVLREMELETSKQVLEISPNTGVRWQTVVSLFRQLTEAGFTEVGFATADSGEDE